MKTTLLFTALFLLFIVSVSLADPMPVPEDAEETIESDGVVEVTVEPKPTKHYSLWAAGFGNLIPGLGYFLIDEPAWGWGELGVIGAGALVCSAFAVTGDTSTGIFSVMVFAGVAVPIYFIGLIHAPLLARHKNHQQKVALDLSPGLGLDSVGEVYPTVQLTLSF